VQRNSVSWDPSDLQHTVRGGVRTTTSPGSRETHTGNGQRSRAANCSRTRISSILPAP